MTFGSLFAGIGGLDLGLERAGMECRWQVEMDGWRRGILARHWPDVRQHDDVRTFPPGDANVEGWRVDLICGGDPCQGNSKAGGVWKRPVDDLGVHFLRVAGLLRPRLVLRENPTSTRRDAPWPWHRFRSGLESLGYTVLPFRLRACCLGLDHQRDRLFLLAELSDPDRLGLEGVDGARFAAGHAGGTAGGPVRCAGRDQLPPPRICGKSDGFPAGLVRRRLTALGDAVPPAMAEWIGRRIMESVRG